MNLWNSVREFSTSQNPTRFALERGYLDAWLEDYLVQPFLRVLRLFDSLEDRWCRLLSGDEPPATPLPGSPSPPVEDSL